MNKLHLSLFFHAMNWGDPTCLHLVGSTSPQYSCLLPWYGTSTNHVSEMAWKFKMHLHAGILMSLHDHVGQARVDKARGIPQVLISCFYVAMICSR